MTETDTDAAAYLTDFVEAGGVDWERLATNLRPRPPSERLRLLFDWEAWPFQREIIDDDSPDVVANTGRQVGKTETGGAIGADRTLFKAIPRGADVLFAGDVHDTAQEMFRRCKGHFRRSPLSLDQFGVTKANERTWEFDTGTRILTGSLKNGGDNLRGLNPVVVIVDESALVEERACTDVIEPMFNTWGDEHEFYLFSTPRGKSGYHYKAWSGKAGFERFSAHHVPSSASPIVSESELDQKRDQVDSFTWRQEYLGEFVEAEDAWIPSALYDSCERDPAEYREDPPRYLGVDVARQGRDRTVYLDMDADGVVRRLESEDESTMPGVLGRIQAWHADAGYERILVDEGSFGGGVVDFAGEHADLRGTLDPYTFSLSGKQDLFQTLKTSFERGELYLPEHRRLRIETTELQYEFTQTGTLKLSHPEGGHDDFPDALALANYARTGAGQQSVRRRRPAGASTGNVRSD